jgi:IS605 OrfB family transposase
VGRYAVPSGRIVKGWSVRLEPSPEQAARFRRAKQKVARVHMRAAAVRADTIHQATSELAKTHGQIVIEDLYLRGFARGMRKHRRAWAEAAFGEFRRQLAYKCGWYGSELRPHPCGVPR